MSEGRYDAGLFEMWSTWSDDALSAVEIWTSGSGEEWAVEFKLVEINGRWECVGFALASFTDPEDTEGKPRHLQAKTVREFPFASELARARRDTARLWRDYGTGLTRIAEAGGGVGSHGIQVRVSETAAEAAVDRGEWFTDQLDPADGTKTGRRRRWTRAHLETVAAIYRRAYSSPETGGRHGYSAPSRAVAEALGVSRGQARKLVWQARRKGLLGETEEGQAGGVSPTSGEAGAP